MRRSVCAEREHLQEQHVGGECSLASSFESRSHELDFIAECWRSATEFSLSSIINCHVRRKGSWLPWVARRSRLDFARSAAYTFFASNPGDKDSFMTTPAHFVPAAQLARSGRSEEVVAKHKKYLWPSVTNYFQQPLVADHGEMQHLWDLEGNKYLDFFGGILTVSVGHCNPKITSKVSAQVNRLQHTSTLYPNEHIAALAAKIAQITPGNLQQSLFTNSGTEANEAAILLARRSTGSFDVVALRHPYSAGSALAKAVTAHAPYRKGG